MHSDERERLIFELLKVNGFVSFQDLDSRIEASPATIRRDLERLAADGLLYRVRGGAKLTESATSDRADPNQLLGAPFHENIALRAQQKQAIGKTAAALCSPGEAIMIDGGSTTLTMCPNLAGLNLQVLTNSLHIVSALLPQVGTRILVPAGTVFREQNIILSADGEEGMPRFHAPKLFMGAAAIGAHGLMQADIVLIAAERRLIERAEEIIILIDSSKFKGPSGHVVSDLSEIDVVITDEGATAAEREMIRDAGVRLIIADS